MTAGGLRLPRCRDLTCCVVQAGSSEAGKVLAARAAEVLLTAQQTLQDAVDFYADLKGRLAAHGRDPASLLVMPGVFVMLPNGLSDFAEWVLIELRRRGLARTEYDGATLRAKLGLKA